MVAVTLQDLFQAGAHFGHRTRFWNPKMSPYIYGVRQDLHMIDLRQTVPLFEAALEYVDKIVSTGGRILFVGTKRVAQGPIAEYAKTCGMPYVDQRWCGGTLTNFKTIRKSVNRMIKLEQQMLGDSFNKRTKKERLNLTRDVDKLNAYLGGIRDMNGLPDALFVVDVNQEHIAVKEAARLSIPVIGLLDTNASPEGISYPIPGNDDSMASIDYFLKILSEHIMASQAKRKIQKVEKAVEPVITTVAKSAEKVAEKATAVAQEATDAVDATKTKAKKVVKRVAAAKDKAVDTAKDKAAEAVKPAATKKAPAKKATTAKTKTDSDASSS